MTLKLQFCHLLPPPVFVPLQLTLQSGQKFKFPNSDDLLKAQGRVGLSVPW